MSQPQKRPSSLTEALLAFNAGDPEALELIYRVVQPRLLGYVRKSFPDLDHDEVDDVIQQTFWEFSRSSGGMTWLVAKWFVRAAERIAIRQVERRRDLARRSSPLGAEHPASSHEQPEVRVASEDQAIRIREAFAALPSDQKEVLLLWMECPYSEIARARGVEVSSVYRLVQRTKKAFALSLRAHGVSTAVLEIFIERFVDLRTDSGRGGPSMGRRRTDSYEQGLDS